MNAFETRMLLGIAAIGFTATAETASAQSIPEVPRPDALGVVGVSRDPKAREALAELGVGWVRIGEYQLGERRDDLTRIPREGYGLWLTLFHRDRANVADARAFDASERGGFPPADGARYQELVRSTVRPLVEGLRAAGRDPARWLVVQIENEVLPRDVLPPDRPRRFWHGTGEEYLSTLALAYEAVKSVEPSVPVAAAGISSEMLAELVRGEHRLITSWGERLLKEGRFDWADVHLYNRVDEIPAKVAWVRARWAGPIAGTEVGGPDEASGARYSEELHAEDVAARIGAAREAGVRRIFWSPFFENPNLESRFVPMCLVASGGRRKPAFAVLSQLAAE
ncbi:MAG: hypothetical protein HY720_06580 [Planctomycetes bacterium]|nr:hypothetical protein [Planctomycetota bacterium]